MPRRRAASTKLSPIDTWRSSSDSRADPLPRLWWNRRNIREDQKNHRGESLWNWRLLQKLGRHVWAKVTQQILLILKIHLMGRNKQPPQQYRELTLFYPKINNSWNKLTVKNRPNHTNRRRSVLCWSVQSGRRKERLVIDSIIPQQYQPWNEKTSQTERILSGIWNNRGGTN